MDKYRTYEIYCEEFSEVIQAETLLQAVTQFEVNNPSYNVIFAEDAEFRF